MEGIARILTVPFRWTEGTAQLQSPAGKAPYQILSFQSGLSGPGETSAGMVDYQSERPTDHSFQPSSGPDVYNGQNSPSGRRMPNREPFTLFSPVLSGNRQTTRWPMIMNFRQPILEI